MNTAGMIILESLKLLFGDDSIDESILIRYDARREGRPLKHDVVSFLSKLKKEHAMRVPIEDLVHGYIQSDWSRRTHEINRRTVRKYITEWRRHNG